MRLIVYVIVAFVAGIGIGFYWGRSCVHEHPRVLAAAAKAEPATAATALVTPKVPAAAAQSATFAPPPETPVPTLADIESDARANSIRMAKMLDNPASYAGLKAQREQEVEAELRIFFKNVALSPEQRKAIISAVAAQRLAILEARVLQVANANSIHAVGELGTRAQVAEKLGIDQLAAAVGPQLTESVTQYLENVPRWRYVDRLDERLSGGTHSLSYEQKAQIVALLRERGKKLVNPEIRADVEAILTPAQRMEYARLFTEADLLKQADEIDRHLRSRTP